MLSGPFPPPPPSVILIAEPDIALAVKLAAKLRSIGCMPVLAHDGYTALGLALALAPKAVVTELALPMLSGFDLCGRLREHPQTSAATMVAVTTTEVDLGLAPGERGFDAYLTKPYTLDSIVRAIDVAQRVDDDTDPGWRVLPRNTEP